MFCPKCGKEMRGTACDYCGYGSVRTVPSSTTRRKAPPLQIDLPKLIILTVIAIVVLILFLNAANTIAYRGYEITQIESVGGQTLDEAYYLQIGNMYAGFAVAIRAFGIFCAAVLVALGYKK